MEFEEISNLGIRVRGRLILIVREINNCYRFCFVVLVVVICECGARYILHSGVWWGPFAEEWSKVILFSLPCQHFCGTIPPV